MFSKFYNVVQMCPFYLLFLKGIILKDYYSVRGWNEHGHPTKEKLTELGLAEVASELEKKAF